MATGNIRRTGGKRNYAKPTSPSTSSASTTADTTTVTVTYTPSTLGPAATSYLVTGTSTTGATVSTALTTSPTTVTGFSGGSTYTISVAAQNYNGPGVAITAAAGLVIPQVYALQSTYNTNGSYTVASGVTKIAAYVIGAGGGGGGGGTSNAGGQAAHGGGGGGSGAIVGFKDFTVTAGQTVTITIGAGGNSGSRGVINSNPAGGAGDRSRIPQVRPFSQARAGLVRLPHSPGPPQQA